MVRKLNLKDLIDENKILCFPVTYLSSQEASEIMTNFKGQVIRTELKDFLLIEERLISAIHIIEEKEM